MLLGDNLCSVFLRWRSMLLMKNLVCNYWLCAWSCQSQKIIFNKTWTNNSTLNDLKCFVLQNHINAIIFMMWIVNRRAMPLLKNNNKWLVAENCFSWAIKPCCRRIISSFQILDLRYEIKEVSWSSRRER